MFKIGCHLSSSKGYQNMAEEAHRIGANTFQFFTRNPRGGSAKAIDENDIAEFQKLAREYGIEVILAHAPYTLNCCSDKPEVREFAINIMKDDLKRMEYTPNQLYNFHPGSHVGQGIETGIEYIIDALNMVLTAEQSTTFLLETMAGKGSEIGSQFEEIRQIIDGVKLQDKLGVCLDTCHVSDAGYDIVNNLNGVLEEFDKIIGFNRLKAIHLNDSMNPLGAHKDRHQKIGEGTLGIQTFEEIINHPSLKNLPFFLETPNELEGYEKEIAILKKLYV